MARKNLLLVFFFFFFFLFFCSTLFFFLCSYKRLLAGESNLDTDVYEKLLSVNDLSTVMGASAAMQAVYLYKKIDGDSAHDTDDSVKAHSDSWVIKKTSEVCVD
jgi:hypothetical protein